jgi:hypothetical protein
MTMPPIALGDMPTPNERRETGRLAISIVELVRRGQADELHLLLSTINLRELALCLGAFGALVNAMGDQLDAVCIGQVIPPMATDILPQWLASLDQMPRGESH